ncbi:uncharacterized protein si:ch211-153b23.7 isoform X1 [Hippoglossus hippoglossus]|uniref:uncharacterized protein si:ch211-153b23.7 isoform X1 n=1 Tax=Hippoglossus hippoglossus TaxID=8267 RepID=UPI00148D4B1A|nr:uncharacterized protein si:ch211-153b23.7 isoform X1 [Hippoglossus hippoglossus]XP_035016526.1 uncharacterized protein si:ch211-153b23.7 isoform X2 [Hippoglossus stenolepis]
MDGDVLSLSSSPSLSSSAAAVAAETEETSARSDSSLFQGQQKHSSAEALCSEDVSPVGVRLLSTEEQVTLITESMTVTSADQEKLLLLNKNTELRRVNKELMKLNEDWDHVYRSATLGLQHRLEALELENNAVKQLNSRLLLKVEHQQSAKEYYEQALMQELKKNQDLQEYIRLLENRTHHPQRTCTQVKEGSFSAAVNAPVLSPTTTPPRGPDVSPSLVSGYKPSSSFFPASSGSEEGWKRKSKSSSTPLGESQQEVHDLNEQLGALRCQTQIYEAEYRTEHNDHKHTLQENRRLRKKREEMRQQVALLQEQLKVYEDDFRRERADKQMLQRLLLKKTPPTRDPVLVHRCNNAQQPQGGDKRTQSAEKRKQHHPFCLKHQDRHKESD